MTDVDRVLGFWFGPPDQPERERAIWWEKDPAFDAEVRARFLALHEAAASGRCEHWRETAEGALALTLVLDQFPRHMFRGQARAFATDAQALAVAERAIADRFDQALPPIRRKFLYLPLEHAEDFALQERAVALFAAMPRSEGYENDLDFARRHRDIIARFGRFPHRNAALGRATTPDEAAFLAQPGSAF